MRKGHGGNIRAFLLNISLIAAATALFRMIVPDTGFKKQMGFLISCFFVSAVASFITGVTGGWLEIEGFSEVVFETGSGITDFSEQTEQAKKRAVAEEISRGISEILGQNGIQPSEIYVNVNISDEDSISINEIKLVLPPEADFARAAAAVEKEVGKDIRIIIEARAEIPLADT